MVEQQNNFIELHVLETKVASIYTGDQEFKASTDAKRKKLNSKHISTSALQSTLYFSNVYNKTCQTLVIFFFKISCLLIVKL